MFISPEAWPTALPWTATLWVLLCRGPGNLPPDAPIARGARATRASEHCIALPLLAGPSRPRELEEADVRTEAAEAQERRRRALMVAAQAGDAAAYQSLLRDCLPLIRTVVRGQGVPAVRIEDAVQEVLLALHRVRHTYDPSRSFDAWLRAIARYRAIDLMRSEGARSRRETHAPEAYAAYPDAAEPADATLVREAEARALRARVAALPAAQREAVEEVVLADRSLADAAVATRRSSGALKVNLHRALQALRRQVAKGE